MRLFIAALLLIAPLLAAPAAIAAELDVMIGQMLMAGFRGYDAPQGSRVSRDIIEHHLGGVILFDYDMTRKAFQRNIKSPDQTKRLVSALQSFASIPLFVAVDQEGGKVQRLKPEYGFQGTPSAQSLGETMFPDARKAARTIARTLSSVGINMNFAPVADVNVNPHSPAIGALGRSFSSDPIVVGQYDEMFLDLFAQQGVIGCLKHFPGHGSAGADSHLGLTDVTETWSDKELTPYRMLIEAGLPKMIMTAHIFNAHLDPEYPATLSRKTITGLLRDQLGFDGVVITDDMNMKAITQFYGTEEAIRLAIEAGADILLFGNNLVYDPFIVRKAHDIIKQLVTRGVIPPERVEASYERIMRLKQAMLEMK